MTANYQRVSIPYEAVVHWPTPPILRNQPKLIPNLQQNNYQHETLIEGSDKDISSKGN